MGVNIENILREEDIEGLIELGAPGDEYDSEARKLEEILSGWGVRPSEEQIVNVLRDVWSEFFGPFNPQEMVARRDAFQRIAHRILLESSVLGGRY
jgi:hypothetical protein